jgi:hypothetical protein
MMAKLKLLSMIVGFGTALSFLIAAAWRIRSLMRGEIRFGPAETASTAVVFVQNTDRSGTTQSALSKEFVLSQDRQVVLGLVMTART